MRPPCLVSTHLANTTQVPTYVEIMTRGKGSLVTQRGMAAGETHTFGSLTMTWYTVVFMQDDRVVQKECVASSRSRIAHVAVLVAVA